MDYIVGRSRTISGQGEAVSHTYYMEVGNDGRAWFFPSDCDNPADHVYCTAGSDWDLTGKGHGGAPLRLPLKEGGEFILRGGWHTSAEGLKAQTSTSNADSFFEATGVDIRHTHKKFVVISTERVNNPESYEPIMRNVVYIDPPEGRIGTWERGDEIAQGIANALDKPVYLYDKSFGGSSQHWVKPDSMKKEPNPYEHRSYGG